MKAVFTQSGSICDKPACSRHVWVHPHNRHQSRPDRTPSGSAARPNGPHLTALARCKGRGPSSRQPEARRIQRTGSIGVAKPKRASMASAASRHRSSRNRRPVISTPIGNPVPWSRPAGTHAEGNPSRLAGTTGRINSLVAAVPAGEAASKPCSKGNCVQVGESSSGLSAMKIDHARAMPSRSTIRCDQAVASANGGTA